MEEKQEKSKVVQLKSKAGEKVSEIKNKVSEMTFDHLNILKHFTDLDKEVSKNEKEKSLEIIKAIQDLKDDKLKAETLKEYFTSNNQKEVIDKIIYAAKYLTGSVLVLAIAVIIKQKNDN